jgi:signal peptidase II
MMKVIFDKAKGLPFVLTGLVIAADQLVKAIIVKNWPLSGTFIADVFDNEFLQIYHVRNKVIAFSLGNNLPEFLRPPLFIILPMIVLGFLLWYYFTSPDFIPAQRWAVAGIIGGGMGNIIDRIFRPDGVVDFISVRFFGIQNLRGPFAFLSWDRWPTFNIADASVVVSCLVFLFTILIVPKQAGEKAVS